MENSTHYFGAGPATLPDQVKQQVQKDILQFNDSCVSILELSHRSEEFSLILNRARASLRSLYAIPNQYHILFMQGGATAQFDAVPLNLLGKAKHATYLNTGVWSRKSAALASKYTSVKFIEGLEEKHNKICCVASEDWLIDKDSAYFHITPNETIDGIELAEVDYLEIPVVADMTSCLLIRNIDITRYGIIYAGTQKTLGIAGLTVVIVRDDLLNLVSKMTPDLYRYDLHVQEDSIVNTAPVFACYVTQLVLDWVAKSGGVAAMVTQANTRADLLYQSIDESSVIENNICQAYRSSINVVFNSVRKEVIDNLLVAAQKQGLTGLEGHRLVGGIRASMYNGTAMSAVQNLSKLIQQIK